MNNEIDVVVKIMKMWGTKLDSSQSREMELMRKLQSDYIVERPHAHALQLLQTRDGP